MIQFTKEDVILLRQKAQLFPDTIKKLKESVDTVFKGEIIVPKTGIANWRLYYYCPHCSVKLEFDRTKPHTHTCKTCNTTFTGEPYDSSWWGIVTGENYDGCYLMSLLSLITGEEEYALKAKAIMLECARNYPNYEVHGDIPYNGPGRAGAQTLDESGFQRNMALAYDLISDFFTQEEKDMVRDNMFIPGALFLKEHRHNQLHNHEAIINAAIAIIAMQFDNQELIDFAIYEKYGIIYQLEHAMQDNNMWFEGSFGYHFFALQSLLEFEKFAINTKHSQLSHENYKKMFEMVVDYLQPDHKLPMLNDTTFGHSSHYDIFEFVYKYIKTDKILTLLNNTYTYKSRDNIDALLYGDSSLDKVFNYNTSNFHTKESLPGHTILRGSNDKYLLIKHDRYGGEHDHYDRLDLSYLAYNKRISPDLGTTGYGAVLHYAYYKNTASHNTICIGCENQAPVNAKLDSYKEIGDTTYVICSLDYSAPYEKLDSFTIKQWSDECYKDVKMIRKIAFNNDYFIEMFDVFNVDDNLSIDWNMHFLGELVSDYSFNDTTIEDVNVYKYFTDLRQLDLANNYKLTYKVDDVFTYVYGKYTDQKVITAVAPDNPSNTSINFIVERAYNKDYRFAHVIETSKEESIIKEVIYNEDSVIVIHKDSTKKEYKF